MPQARIIVASPRSSSVSHLPGAVVLPDASKRVALGSGVITSVISSGGSAIVYEIWNSDLEVTRAVKLLHPDHTSESAERFQTEMKITAKLHHPNIIEIYAVGKWNGLPYIEMERIDGVTLEELIEDRGALPLEVCISIAIMVGRALNYAHNQDYVLYSKDYHGIIHRDLKPSNIMINKKGQVRLMDFGIAKPLCASMHTCEGAVMGTMQYLPPEQLNGEPVDVRADIYSMGAVVYEMATGAKTFPETNLARLVTDKLSNNFVPLEQFATRMPARFRNLVQKCLHFEKEHRVESALALLRNLSDVHKSITDYSPEQVMAIYMNCSSSERATIAVRRKRNLVPIAIWGATCAILFFTAASLLTGSGWMKKKFFAMNSPWLTSSSRKSDVDLRDKVTEAFLVAPGAPDNDALELPEPVIHKPIVEPDPVLPQRGRAIRQKAVQVSERAPTAPKKPGARASQASSSGSKPRELAKTVPVASPASHSVASPAEQPKRKAVSDPGTVLTELEQSGEFGEMLAVIKALSADQISQPVVQIFKMHALKGLKDHDGLRLLLSGPEIADAEFYLEKAMLLHKGRDHRTAISMLEKASRLPSMLLDSDAIRGRILHMEAQCRSALFNADPGNQNRQEAMESWFKVKSFLRSNPGHEFFKAADSEIRRIGNITLASN